MDQHLAELSNVATFLNKHVFRQYILQYLEDRDLDVYWGTASDLLRTLRERWWQERESVYAD